MPHIAIEYSSNVENLDIAALCDVLRRAAAEQPIFPEDGVRVRAFKAEHCSIADGAPEHGFVDISVRLREGRSHDAKVLATEAIFEAAKLHFANALATRPIMLSLEMRDIDAQLAPKVNTVRDWINRKN